MDTETADLLYQYFHTYQFTQTKNDLGKLVTDKMGVGTHKVAGRVVEVCEPVTKDGWTKYEIKEHSA